MDPEHRNCFFSGLSSYKLVMVAGTGREVLVTWAIIPYKVFISRGIIKHTYGDWFHKDEG